MVFDQIIGMGIELIEALSTKTCLIFFVVSLALLERIEMCVIFERQRNSIFFFLLFSLLIFILLSNLCIASLCGLILCVYTSYDAKTLIL